MYFGWPSIEHNVKAHTLKHPGLLGVLFFGRQREGGSWEGSETKGKYTRVQVNGRP